MVQNDINDAKHKQKIKPTPNLTKSKQVAMKRLSERNNIIMTNAEKRGGAVIIDTGNYVAECERQVIGHGIGANCYQIGNKTCYISKVHKFYVEKGHLC